MADLIIHYTFDTDGTNSGSLGSTYDLTIPSGYSINETAKLIGTNGLMAGNSSTGTLYNSAIHKTEMANDWTTPDNFSISVWANPINGHHGLNQMVIAFSIDTLDNNTELYYTNSGTIGVWGHSQDWIPNNIPSQFDGNWHHYVLTFALNGDVSLYVDNVSYGTNNFTTFSNKQIVSLTMGADADVGNRNILNGYIDDFRIYDNILGVGEISILYLLGTGATIPQLIDMGATIPQLIDMGVYNRNMSLDINHFNQSYVQDFIDISGSVVLQKDANLTVRNNIITGGNVTIQHTQTHSADVTVNKRFVVGGDMSLNANVTVNNNVSMDGNIVRCNLVDSSIPSTAINGVITSGPDFTQSAILYEKGVNVDADASFNGTTVQASNLKIDGNIEFSDGTIMDTYDSNVNISFNTDALISNSTISHLSTYVSNYTSSLECSVDGKYTMVLYGDAINYNNNYNSGNAGRSAILLSSDFGETYNAITLPQSPGYIFSGSNSHLLDPMAYPTVNDFTMVNFTCMGISPSGKNIIIGMSGSRQDLNEWNDASIAFSLDYGTTWTTMYVSSIVLQCHAATAYNWVVYAVACAIDDTGRIVIYCTVTNQYTATTAKGMYYSSDRTNFDFQLAALDKNLVYLINDDIVYAGMGYLYKLTFAGVLRYVNMSSINNGYQRFSLSQSIGNGGICAIFTLGWQSNTTTRPCFFITDDGTTLTATDMSSTTNSIFAHNNYLAMVSAMSLSGKYIMIGATDGHMEQVLNINIRSAGYEVYYSEDYGATFTMMSLVLQSVMPVNYINNIVITDNGYIHVLMRGVHTSISLKFAGSFTSSTFESLTINNTLTAGSFSTSSDYRIKKNIVSLNETNTIDNLRPVKYLQTLLNKEQYGLIAHELQEYYPDLVVGEKDGEDWQRINYTGLIAILINEIKRLKEEVIELENMVH